MFQPHACTARELFTRPTRRRSLSVRMHVCRVPPLADGRATFDRQMHRRPDAENISSSQRRDAPALELEVEHGMRNTSRARRRVALRIVRSSQPLRAENDGPMDPSQQARAGTEISHAIHVGVTTWFSIMFVGLVCRLYGGEQLQIYLFGGVGSGKAGGESKKPTSVAMAESWLRRESPR